MLLWFIGCDLLWDSEPAAPPPPLATADRLPSVPEEQGLPSASAKARPPWYPGTAYAPQAEESVRLSAVPATGEVEGLVTCGIEADYQDPRGLFGQFSAPDLTTELTLGDASVKAHGPDDSRAMRVSAALVRLAPGDPIQVTIFDRDVFKTDQVEVLNGSYEGSFPFELKGSTSSASCEIVPREKVEALVGPLIDEAHAGIQLWQVSLKPDLQLRQLAGPEGRPRDALVESAALVGWQDERIQHLLNEHDKLVSAYKEALTGELAAAAQDSIQFEGLTLSEGQLLCGRDGQAYSTIGGACAVVLTVDGQGQLNWPLEGLSLVWSYGVEGLEISGLGQGEDYVSSPTIPVAGPTTAVFTTLFPTDPEGPTYLRSGSPGSYQYLLLTES